MKLDVAILMMTQVQGSLEPVYEIQVKRREVGSMIKKMNGIRMKSIAEEKIEMVQQRAETLQEKEGSRVREEKIRRRKSRPSGDRGVHAGVWLAKGRSQSGCHPIAAGQGKEGQGGSL